MDEEKHLCRGLTIKVNTEGLDDVSEKLREVNDVAKELETTLAHVVSLLDQITINNSF